MGFCLNPALQSFYLCLPLFQALTSSNAPGKSGALHSVCCAQPTGMTRRLVIDAVHPVAAAVALPLLAAALPLPLPPPPAELPLFAIA